MTVDEAESVGMPFGKHKGRTLGQIAESDVLYLDWLIGQDIRSERLRSALHTVCPARRREIAAALEAGERE